jgi:CMP-N-acetylneuraminic acid synthetase
MRHDSERVPGKNFRPLGDRPLFHHVIGMLLECPTISDVVIDTDSSVIRDDAQGTFPEVTILERPERLRDGSVPMNDVLLNDIEQFPADVYVQTHSTNPFLRSESVEAALKIFAEASDHDSLFSVTRLQTRLWRSDGSPMNHDPRVLMRTQDLQPVFEENSCLYIFSGDTLKRTGSRIGDHPYLFELRRQEALDIDTEEDFEMAEALFAARRSA